MGAGALTTIQAAGSAAIATPGLAARAVTRATVGAMVRAKATRANNAWRIAKMIGLRADDPRPLDRGAFMAAARRLDCHPAVLHAIADVEGMKGRGFGDDGRLIILAEPHVFSRLTGRAFDVSHPHLVYPRWVARDDAHRLPGGWTDHPYQLDQRGRWGLWARWAELDFESACGAISLGKFQIMGYHARALGYGACSAMVRAFYLGEDEQLDGLIRFLEANGITRHVRSQDWRRIAAGYNGTGQVAFYSAKLARAYARRLPEYA